MLLDQGIADGNSGIQLGEQHRSLLRLFHQNFVALHDLRIEVGFQSLLLGRFSRSRRDLQCPQNKYHHQGSSSHGDAPIESQSNMKKHGGKSNPNIRGFRKISNLRTPVCRSPDDGVALSTVRRLQRRGAMFSGAIQKSEALCLREKLSLVVVTVRR